MSLQNSSRALRRMHARYGICIRRLPRSPGARRRALRSRRRGRLYFTRRDAEAGRGTRPDFRDR